jgi:hypothetical protein
MTRKKDKQEIAVLKGPNDSKLFQSHCHSLIGGSTVKCNKREACIELQG